MSLSSSNVQVKASEISPLPCEPSVASEDPLMAFLVKIGRIILKNDKQEWMDVDELHEVASKHTVELEGCNLSRSQLEHLLKKGFKDREEVSSEGVNVVAYERRRKWGLLLMVRFYRYNPEYTLTKLRDLVNAPDVDPTINPLTV